MIVSSTFLLIAKNNHYIYKIHTSFLMNDDDFYEFFQKEVLNFNNNFKTNFKFTNRKTYTTEFSKWSYGNNDLQAILFDLGSTGKLIYEDDRNFFKKSFIVNYENRYILDELRNNIYIKNKIENITKDYRSLILYITSKNQEKATQLSKHLENTLIAKIEKSFMTCNEQLKKIEELHNYRNEMIQKKFPVHLSDFMIKMKNRDYRNYNCDIYHFEKAPLKIDKKYNTKLFWIFLLFLNILIVIPVFLRINK